MSKRIQPRWRDFVSAMPTTASMQKREPGCVFWATPRRGGSSSTLLHGALLLLATLAASCIDFTTGLGPSQRSDLPWRNNDGPWAIAVVGSDYYSTSISIVDRSTQDLFREGVVDSGSSAAGLSVALSGDIWCPRTYNQQNWLVLLDRFPNSVLTVLNPHGFAVNGQLSVATGFAANPHDFLWVDTHRAYVTRYEKNPQPGRKNYDEGDDTPTPPDILRFWFQTQLNF